MTYCVGMRLNTGLIFMSDTRTNAGVDNISTVKKMHTWDVPGERVIVAMTAGNLATTQSVISLLDERANASGENDSSILQAPSMFQIARQVGRTLREVISDSTETGQQASSAFGATLIVGGQIKGEKPRLFLIYSEGNFIEASDDAPFFQIGEAKYGKPILVRAHDPKMSFEDSVKLLMVSFDSTIKSNLSVGLPLDYVTYETDSLEIGRAARVEQDDPYYQNVSSGWGEALNVAFAQLPPFQFED